MPIHFTKDDHKNALDEAIQESNRSWGWTIVWIVATVLLVFGFAYLDELKAYLRDLVDYFGGVK